MKRKDAKLWICAAAYAVIVWSLSRCMGGWGDPRGGGIYRVLPELLIPLVWMAGVYWKWSGNWTREDDVPWLVLLLMVNLPYLPPAVVGYGTWLCPIGSMLVGVGCVVIKKKCG